MRQWLKRSTPRSVILAVAILLGIAAIVFSQVSGFVNQHQEHSDRQEQVGDLQRTVDQLTTELRCRGAQNNKSTVAELRLVRATALGLVALVDNNDPALADQAKEIRLVADDVGKLIHDRENSSGGGCRGG